MKLTEGTTLLHAALEAHQLLDEVLLSLAEARDDAQLSYSDGGVVISLGELRDLYCVLHGLVANAPREFVWREGVWGSGEKAAA